MVLFDQFFFPGRAHSTLSLSGFTLQIGLYYVAVAVITVHSLPVCVITHYTYMVPLSNASNSYHSHQCTCTCIYMLTHI